MTDKVFVAVVYVADEYTPYGAFTDIDRAQNACITMLQAARPGKSITMNNSHQFYYADNETGKPAAVVMELVVNSTRGIDRHIRAVQLMHEMFQESADDNAS